MRYEISIAYTASDELAFVEAIRQQFDLWSLPSVFKAGEGIAKPLGSYLDSDQKIFFAGEVDTISYYIKAIVEYNLLTSDEIETDNFHLSASRYDSKYLREAFYLLWQKPQVSNGKIRSGRIVSDFYLNLYPTPPEIIELFSFLEGYIKQTFPYLTTKPNPGYVGKEMAQLVLSSQQSLCYDMRENPDFRN